MVELHECSPIALSTYIQIAK
uniref:Uncharacterized protein n=1 Tax=Magnetococcus massalia (strain MO-1) TaxID=451514 RepID=A0A1S7LE64_MAGMO|nr:protein of unknown function [Candidatus Magnetococcus massalia]